MWGIPAIPKDRKGLELLLHIFLNVTFDKSRRTEITNNHCRRRQIDPPTTPHSRREWKRFHKSLPRFRCLLLRGGGLSGPPARGGVERPRELTTRGWGIMGSFLDEILNYDLSGGVVVNSTWGVLGKWMIMGGAIFQKWHSGFRKT